MLLKMNYTDSHYAIRSTLRSSSSFSLALSFENGGFCVFL
jgi:hypothetical protein